MPYKFIALFMLFLFTSFTTSCASADKNYRNNSAIAQDTLTHDGYTREYITYLPASRSNNKKVPLLIVLHGGSGNSKQIMRATRNRFNELADIHEFYVVYPQGIEKGWNDGRRDLKQFATQKNIDDVGFIRILIHKLQDEYSIDENRVFVTGISNGGFMSFRLGCELRDEIRAIAPVTATIAEDALKYCQGKSNTSLVLFNGTDDPLVPYDGGYVQLFGNKRGKITSTQQTINRWANMLSCNRLPKKTEPLDKKNDGTTIIKFEYQGCKNNNAVTLYRINGGGHTWPGGKPALKRIVGTTSEEIVACDEIWKFFSQL